MRAVALLLLSLACPTLFAERGVLKADCKLLIKGTQTGRSTVTVIPRDVAPYRIRPTNGHFTIDLPLEETYLIQFEHDGCVSKQLYFDTRVPAERYSTGFDFPLQVTLEKHKENFAYSGPVGFIQYQAQIADFGYQTDYKVMLDPPLQQRVDDLRTNGTETLGTASTVTLATAPPSPEPEDVPLVPTSEWGTEAPTLAHVPRKVHRLGTATQDTPPAAMVPIPPVPVVASPITEEPEPEALPAPASSSAEPLLNSRNEELIVERNRITTIVRLDAPKGGATEFRRVAHRYGAVFYFQDGASITEAVYRTLTGR